MDDRKITAEQLKAGLSGQIDELLEQVAKAMNSAQPGRIIAESEELVRDASAVFREQLYQKAMELLQAKQEAFFPSGDGKGRMAEQGAPSDEPSDS